MLFEEEKPQGGGTPAFGWDRPHWQCLLEAMSINVQGCQYLM
jgi:hypothetical protein